MAHRTQLSLFDIDTGADTDPSTTNDVQPNNDGAVASRVQRIATEVELNGLLIALGNCTQVAVAGCVEDGQLLGLALYTGADQPWYLGSEANKGWIERLVAALVDVPKLLTHDAKALLHRLRGIGIEPRQLSLLQFADVMVAAHLCNVPTADISLPNLVAQYLPASETSAQSNSNLTASSRRSGMSSQGRVRASVSAATDIWHLHTVLWPRMAALGVTQLFNEVEIPLLSVLFQMEADGVAVDLAYLAALSSELGERISELEKAIFAQAGHSFNVGSPQQLSRVLFDEMKLPTDKLHKTWRSGNVSTSAWSLDEIKDLHPMIPLVLDHRELSKLKNTYCDAFPTLVDLKDHLLRTTFQQVNTITGRLSSTHPNLQNIPITSEMGRRVRQAFVSRWGRAGCIISADYSQVELRILAHLATDAALIAAFERGEDIHARTAATVYQVPISQVTTEQRGHAKKLVFGIAYGMGAKSLAASTGMSLQDAKDFINRYFRVFPALHRWIAQTKREARENGYVTTLLGRRRNLPRLLANSGASDERRAQAEREAINTPVQGSAAELIKIAMIKLQARLRVEGLASKMVLQVHDELVFDVPVGEVEAVSRIIREEMCQAYPLRAKLDIDLAVGANWDSIESTSQ